MSDRLERVIGDIEVMLGVDLGKGERRVLLDALEALKACVPRVLSLEELALAKNRWVWMERWFCRFSGKPYAVEPEYYTGQDDRGNQFFLDRASRPNAYYGVKWRCWSAEPSEEQMRLTKWNG